MGAWCGQPQAEHWLPLINRIRQSGKRCQVYVSTQGALSILHELGGKGLALVINETLTPEQGKAFLNEIRSLENDHLQRRFHVTSRYIP
jgi:hypothetical protein